MKDAARKAFDQWKKALVQSTLPNGDRLVYTRLALATTELLEAKPFVRPRKEHIQSSLRPEPLTNRRNTTSANSARRSEIDRHIHVMRAILSGADIENMTTCTINRFSLTRGASV